MRWPWSKRRAEPQVGAHQRWIERKYDDGFREWATEPPDPTAIVEVTRYEWGGIATQMWRVAGVHPAVNAAGLYWRHWHGETIQPGEAVRVIEGRAV